MQSTVAIAVASPSFCRNRQLREELLQLSSNVSFNFDGCEFQEEGLIAFLRASRCEIAVIGREPVTARVLNACPHLKMIAKYGVGLDNIDGEALNSHGVCLGWTPGVNKRAVSELVLGFMLSHFRNIDRSIQQMRRGEWHKDGGTSLEGLQVGIVGFGNVGSDLAALLSVFNAEVVYCDIADRLSVAHYLGARRLSYEALLASSDVISFHVPLTTATRGMFGSNEIALTKNTALIINTARGAVVNISEVCAAVLEKRLGGFAADVFPEEPFVLPERWRGENLYFTPHSGGNSRQAVLAMGRSALDHIKKYVVSVKY